MRSIAHLRCGWRPTGCAGAARAIGHLAAQQPNDTEPPSCAPSVRRFGKSKNTTSCSGSVGSGCARVLWPPLASPATARYLGRVHRRGLHVSCECFPVLFAPMSGCSLILGVPYHASSSERLSRWCWQITMVGCRVIGRVVISINPPSFTR